MGKKTKLRLGFRGNFREISVTLPEGEPVPWAIEDPLRVVGTRVPRVDGPLKVSGEARYTFDLHQENMLHGAVLRCPLPHARLKRIDTGPAKAHPEVRAVLVLDSREYLFAGAEVAALAATSAAAAREALALIDVEYEPLTFVTDPEQARKPDAPQVHPSGNVVRTVRESRGDIVSAFEKADLVVEATYRTPVALHCCLEGHGSLARWEGDQLTLWDSTQAVFDVRDALAAALGIPTSKVRVIKDHAGGGFGSKLEMGSHSPIAARLAREAAAPVRLLLSREEDFLATGNRHSSVQTVKLGGNRDGTLTALSWRTYGTGGIGGGAQTSGPLEGLYRFPNLEIEESDVFTHAGAACPMRAPGHVQGVVALEAAIDDFCEAARLDPVEVRVKNDPSPIRQAEFRLGADRFGWRERPRSGSAPGPLKRGMGVAGTTWDGSGMPGPRAEVAVHADGRVIAWCGTQDIGTGTRTIMAQVVAEELGLEVEDIEIQLGDSYFPYSVLSGGSLTAATVTPVVRKAALKVRHRLLELAAPLLNGKRRELQTRNRLISHRKSQISMTWEEVFEDLGKPVIKETAERIENFQGFHSGTAGCQFIEVEVDVEVGTVRVSRVLAVHDSGRIVNPLLWESQVNGGILQGISFALLEERVIDHRYGKVLNANMESYKILGSMEVPPIEILPFPVAAGYNNTQVLGIGEPAIIPTAAAVSNAVANAIGIRIHDLPITPDKILDALESVTPRKS